MVKDSDSAEFDTLCLCSYVPLLLSKPEKPWK